MLYVFASSAEAQSLQYVNVSFLISMSNITDTHSILFLSAKSKSLESKRQETILPNLTAYDETKDNKQVHSP